ncbi:MAG TPA: hypothetical protein VG944_02645, partial [Fimbriimonas sp.]|nr:hypothetical protein [Fimbriimonas sp.]
MSRASSTPEPYERWPAQFARICAGSTVFFVLALVFALSFTGPAFLSLLPSIIAAGLAVSFLGWAVASLSGGPSVPEPQTVHRLAEPIPDASVQREVKVEVCQGRHTTGRDAGLLWFADGKLYFVGDRTSFAIPLQQNARVSLLIPPSPSPRGCIYRIQMRVKGPLGPCSLKLHVQNYGADKRFEDAFEAMWFWRGLAGGPGQYPPLEIGPGHDQRRDLRTQIAAWFRITDSQ